MSTSIRELIFNGEVDVAYRKEVDLTRKLLKIEKPIEKEWKNYLCCGGFPYGINLENKETCKQTAHMLDRVIEKMYLILGLLDPAQEDLSLKF